MAVNIGFTVLAGLIVFLLFTQLKWFDLKKRLSISSISVLLALITQVFYYLFSFTVALTALGILLVLFSYLLTKLAEEHANHQEGLAEDNIAQNGFSHDEQEILTVNKIEDEQQSKKKQRSPFLGEAVFEKQDNALEVDRLVGTRLNSTLEEHEMDRDEASNIHGTGQGKTSNEDVARMETKPLVDEEDELTLLVNQRLSPLLDDIENEETLFHRTNTYEMTKEEQEQKKNERHEKNLESFIHNQEKNEEQSLDVFSLQTDRRELFTQLEEEAQSNK
ncbi:ABC transporter permease [Halalkalibacterium ligniniphilum]|uniref:ABC transporter permease n=1 Tax=Halalkalibacterium ligniniphilum TaxID=1134413 RepID=UPI00034C157F|nr:ABC transporter permease [Halalkalibacterium ligniniphilum]